MSRREKSEREDGRVIGDVRTAREYSRPEVVLGEVFYTYESPCYPYYIHN
jgi:hypothetical protein